MMFVQETRKLLAEKKVVTSNIGRISWLRQNANGKLLDVGCFDGAIFRDYPDYTGVDNFGGEKTNRILPEHVEQIKQAMRGRNFIEADTSDLPFEDNTFDTVVGSELLEHIWEPVQALREMVRVTKLGGAIILTVPHEFLWPPELKPFTHDGHMHFFTDYTLMSLIREVGGTEVEQFIHDSTSGFVYFYAKLRKVGT